MVNAAALDVVIPGPTPSVGGAVSLPPPVQAVADKVSALKPNSKLYDLCIGLAKSRIFRAILFAAAAVTVVTLVSAAFVAVAAALANPATWVVLVAVAVTALAFAIIIQLPCKGKQKMSFECTAFLRLFRKQYNEINFGKKNHEGKIFLGALPNRLTNDGEKLKKKEGISAVLSLNEQWERKPVGVSLPYNSRSWGLQKGYYKKIEALDHKLLDTKALHEAADFIHKHISAGENVYIHCRAGVGRSAMAVAAYLIKYQGKTVKQACEIIKTSRPRSTIKNKTSALDAFKADNDAKNPIPQS